MSIFAIWVSRYILCRSRISNIKLFIDYDLSGATYGPPNNLWEVKFSECQILLRGCLYIGFLGLGFQKQSYLWTLTSRRPHICLKMTSERSKFSKCQILLHECLHRIYGSRISKKKLFMDNDLSEDTYGPHNDL